MPKKTLPTQNPFADPLKTPELHPGWDVFDGWTKGGPGDDVLWATDGGDAFEGGAGTDTVNYSNSDDPDGVFVNLERGIGNNGHAQGDSYSSIENVVGSKYGDQITGSGADNYISAGSGDDAIILTDGSDTVDGGSGIDTLIGRTDGIGIDLEAGIGTSGIAFGDRYVSIENVLLIGDDSTVVGDGGNNWIAGSGANFTVSAGDGNDLISVAARGGSVDGGNGIDTLDYSGFHTAGSFGVWVDLAGEFARTNNFGGGAVQTVTGIENVIGTAGLDVLFENSDDNVFTGNDGRDTFVFDHDFSGERDVIIDFEVGLDLIDLDATDVRNYNDLLTPGDRFMEQVGNDTVIHTGNGNEILLQGVRTADLSAVDFVF